MRQSSIFVALTDVIIRQLTKKQLAEITGVSTKTIERELKEMGYSHSGARKKGQWEGPVQ